MRPQRDRRWRNDEKKVNKPEILVQDWGETCRGRDDRWVGIVESKEQMVRVVGRFLIFELFFVRK